jgi:membrane protease YdiL (CAAX protease family)
LHRRRLAVTGAAYALLALVGFTWSALRGDPTPWATDDAWLPLAPGLRAAVSAILGVLIAAATVYSTRVLVRRTRWARQLHSELRAVLGPLTGGEIAAYALFSSVAEELFFRGAMQPALGLALSALIFGAVHVGPTRGFLAWPVWAAVMGLVFGATVALTGYLHGAILAHFLINYENLHFLDTHDPAATLADDSLRGRPADASAPPRLGATRVRTGR